MVTDVERTGVWYHETRPITISLVVDNFGVKYITKEYVDHLIVSLQSNYTLTEDWKGYMYCGISLQWDYINKTVDISMP
jgi:hypothetical protein